MAILAAFVGGFLLVRKHGESEAAASAGRVARCLQAGGHAASVESSSTGARQVAVPHGPGALGPDVTLESSTTYVSFLGSEDEAAWFEGQLRQAPGSSPALVDHRGNAVVTFGSTATAGERAAISACLS